MDSFTIQEFKCKGQTAFTIEYKEGILDEDIEPDLGKRIYQMWIKNIREKMNWKVGEKIYIFTKSNCSQYFNVWCSKDKKDIGFANIIIDRNGFASNRYYNMYSLDDDKDDEIYGSFFVRSNSAYNDMVCDGDSLI